MVTGWTETVPFIFEIVSVPTAVQPQRLEPRTVELILPADWCGEHQPREKEASDP